MLKVNGEVLDQRYFPDGTPLMKFRSKDIKVVVTWLYDGEHELPRLIYLTKHLRAHGHTDITLYLPYIPNARMDRVKADDEVFTLKYFAEVINSLEFVGVYVLDPHSNVATALLDRVHVLEPANFIAMALREISDPDLAMVYPDEGAMKRYSGMLSIPYGFGVKNRDWSTGAIKDLQIMGDGLKDKKTVLICDDICSRGGTFYHTAKALKDMGVEKIYLYITHCENTVMDGDLIKSGLLAGIFTTDSIFRRNHPLIKVFDVEVVTDGN